MFNVRYTTLSGDYKNSTMIQSTNKGVLLIPNLINGKTYYAQIQRLKQNTYASPWSAEVAIKPDGGQVTETPSINGVVKTGKQALILFTPVAKSTGYILKYHIMGDKDWKEVQIAAAQIDQFMLKDLIDGLNYEFKLAAVNSIGISDFSSPMTSFKR